MRRTIVSLTPGASDPMMRASLQQPQDGDVSKVALWLGLLAAVFAMTTAMGQVSAVRTGSTASGGTAPPSRSTGGRW